MFKKSVMRNVVLIVDLWLLMSMTGGQERFVIFLFSIILCVYLCWSKDINAKIVNRYSRSLMSRFNLINTKRIGIVNTCLIMSGSNYTRCKSKTKDSVFDLERIYYSVAQEKAALHQKQIHEALDKENWF